MIRINVENIENWELIKKYHEEYYHEAVIKIIENKSNFTTLIAKEIKETKVKNAVIDEVKLTKKIIEFLNILKSVNLATGDILVLKKAIESYDQFLKSLTTETDKKIIKKILKKIFDYKNFNKGRKIEIHGEKTWNRHELLSLMGIRTCPYCNRQYITNYIDKENTSKTTADIDHFYLQSEYPILALSLYNFIPSCQICNSRMKGSHFKSEEHIYPYSEEFGSDCKFRINSANLNFLWEEMSEFEINIEPKFGSLKEDKIINSIEKFKINEVYQIHKDYVQELIKKAIIYDESAIKNIATQYPSLFKSEEEIWQCVMGNYLCEEELGKRPLAKLAKDISEEFGISIS